MFVQEELKLAGLSLWESSPAAEMQGSVAEVGGDLPFLSGWKLFLKKMNLVHSSKSHVVD